MLTPFAIFLAQLATPTPTVHYTPHPTYIYSPTAQPTPLPPCPPGVGGDQCERPSNRLIRGRYTPRPLVLTPTRKSR